MLRSSIGAARLAGRGAPGQLGWCQGSDSTPPNSRAGAASELCPPGFNAFSAAPSHTSTAASPLALLCSGQEGGKMNPPPEEPRITRMPQRPSDLDCDSYSCGCEQVAAGCAGPCILVVKVIVSPSSSDVLNVVSTLRGRYCACVCRHGLSLDLSGCGNGAAFQEAGEDCARPSIFQPQHCWDDAQSHHCSALKRAPGGSCKHLTLFETNHS